MKTFFSSTPVESDKTNKDDDSDGNDFICKTCDSVDNYDFILKCIIVGDSGVGKTSILHRLTKQGFMLNQAPTVGIDFGTVYTKIYAIDNTKDNIVLASNEIALVPIVPKNTTKNSAVVESIKLQIWDCAGQIRFRSIVQSYFRQAKLVFFVYDTNNYESFRQLSDWITTVNDHIGKDKYVGCIIGNKSDLALMEEAPLIEKFCKENSNINFYLLSAKSDTYESVSKPLEDCVLSAYKRYKDGNFDIARPYWNKDTVKLKTNGNPKGECFSCALL